MSVFRPFHTYVLIALFILVSATSKAQLPVCSGTGSGLIYSLNYSINTIENYDPTQPLSITNPSANTIPWPPGAIGLAVSENINGPGPSPTFYSIDGGGIYLYWDGVTWVNTGHSAGNAASVNPGAGGGYIYSLVGANGEIWRYDGTGNAVLIVTIPDFNTLGPFDLAADCNGNFYILNTTNNWLRQYNSSGVLQQTWTTTGGQIGSYGGGMGIIGNTVYYEGTGGLWSGPMVGSTINFTNIDPIGISAMDFASCQLGGVGDQSGVNQTHYYCGTGPAIELVSSGNETDTITWSVQSGNAVITGTGDTVMATATTTSIIYATSTTTCGFTQDTFRIVVPTATVNAGVDDTIYGCGVFHDTLLASVTGLTSGVTYNYTWTPSAGVLSGGNSLTPIVDAGVSTQFVITVTTTQGGCTWSDTVDLFPVNVDVTADFLHEIRFGCSEDTVILTNTSSFATNYVWDFGDGSVDTATNPVHIYTTQGNYVIKLVVNNVVCYDSIIASVDLNHPLDAQFTVDNDTICQGQTVTFTNTSTATFVNAIPPTFYWDLGDGNTSTAAGPIHTYASPGVYQVKLVAGDAVPCWDTAMATIVVDSQSTVEIMLSDSVICAGQKVFIESEYLEEGLLTYSWNLGDGILLTDQAPATHTYEYPGTYQINLAIDYHVCNDVTTDKIVTVHAIPSIALGEDTSFCPNAGAMPLHDINNIGNPNASWLWSTGETGGAISVKAPGEYYAVVTIDGCSNTDSVRIWKDCYLDVPNSFTPDGDNLNDYFMPRQWLSRSVTAFKMTIYNRWGQEIYTTNRIDGRGWDGRFNGEPQPQGVYVYAIEVTFADHRTEKKQGNVTLLR